MATKSTKTTKAASKKTTKAPAKKSAASKSTCTFEYNDGDGAPISAFGYFGFQFLFAIPIVGWVLCVAFALMAPDRNLRSFARSQTMWLVLWIVCLCSLAALGTLRLIAEGLGWL